VSSGLGGAAAADSPAARVERLGGPAVTIEAGTGRLDVVVEQRSDVEISWRGAKRWVEGVTARQQGGVARLDASGAGGSANVVIGGGSVSAANITTIVSGGGSASVSIGGRETGSGSSEPPPEIRVRMPANGDLTVSGAFSGCTIGRIGGRVSLSLAAGTCTVAGAGKGGQVMIDGSGSARLAEAAGDLDLVIAGAGDLSVERAALGRLGARIDGTGTIRVEGGSETADLTLNGAGSIRVGRVAQRPRATLNGAGTIEVGNWR